MEATEAAHKEQKHEGGEGGKKAEEEGGERAKETKGKEKAQTKKGEEENEDGADEDPSAPPHASAGYFNDEQEATAVRFLSQGFLEHLNEPLLKLAKELHELE